MGDNHRPLQHDTTMLLRCSKELLSRFKDYCAERGSGLSAMMRTLIERALESSDDPVAREREDKDAQQRAEKTRKEFLTENQTESFL